MSDLRQWQVRWIMTGLLSAVLIICFLPADASNLPAKADKMDHALSTNIEVAAFAPHEADHSMPPVQEAGNGSLTSQLMEAKHLLHRLHGFAETAKQAIETARRLETLRAEAKHLKESLAAASIDRLHLQDAVTAADNKSDQLSKMVISSWLKSLELQQKEAGVDERLAKARADWARTRLRLDGLFKDRAQQRQKTRDLRAETATLAAEIGRMKREIINVKRETQLIDDHRLEIKTATRQLRHDISAELRNILTAK